MRYFDVRDDCGRPNGTIGAGPGVLELDLNDNDPLLLQLDAERISLLKNPDHDDFVGLGVYDLEFWHPDPDDPDPSLRVLVDDGWRAEWLCWVPAEYVGSFLEALTYA